MGFYRYFSADSSPYKKNKLITLYCKNYSSDIKFSTLI